MMTNQKDALIWFKNSYSDENDADNVNKPYYMVIQFNDLIIFKIC